MASRKSSSPLAYSDVKHVMDLALEKPGLRYILKSHGAAVQFKQRCNRFRNLMREMAAETVLLPGMRAETAYDILVISQIDESGQPTGMGCIIEFKHIELRGTLVDPETGKEIEIPGVTNIIKEN